MTSRSNSKKSGAIVRMPAPIRTQSNGSDVKHERIGVMVGCTEHPRSEARATCTGCSRLLCAECVALPLDSNDERCVHCNAVATPVARAPAAVVAPAARRASLPGATVVGSGAILDSDASPVTKVLSFLFARETLWTLVALTVFTTILRGIAGNALGMIGGVTLGLVATAIEISYYFRVLTNVASGETEFHTPDFSSLGEDVYDPLIRYVATLVPMVIAVFWLGEITSGHWLHGLALMAERPHAIFDHFGPGLLFGAWLALWPLMTMIAAIGKSIINTYNPWTWIKTLTTLKMHYVVGASIFYALVLAEAYMILPLAGVLAIPYIGVLAVALLMNFAMVVRGCVLGIVCEPYV
ncbi:MAG: B-box zinc finger protein [Kofleriaceae bacterium]